MVTTADPTNLTTGSATFNGDFADFPPSQNLTGFYIWGICPDSTGNSTAGVTIAGGATSGTLTPATVPGLQGTFKRA